MTAATSPWKMKATSGGGAEFVPPAGNHQAVLVAIVDLGTHTETFKADGKTKASRKVYLAWELVEETAAGLDRNHVIGERYTLSFGSKSKLRLLVESWSGKKLAEGEEFDVDKLLGKRCMLNVVHKQSGDYVNANIGQIAPCHKSLPATAGKLKPFMWFIGADEPYPDPLWMPKVYGSTVPDLIAASAEMGGKQPAAATNGQADDTDPF